VSDTVVLCYHALSPDWAADLSVTADAFERQLHWLSRRGYEAVTFTEAALGTSSGRRVAITFDDGFASVAHIGRPILEAAGMTATVFAVTSFAERGTPLVWAGIDQWRGGEHDAELQSLGWDALRELRAGGWEVASHTVTHPRLTTLADGDLARELTDSREACTEALGDECRVLCYPYGDVDGRVVAAAGAAGYTAAAGLPARWAPAIPLNVPRVGVWHGDDLRRFAVKSSRAVRAARTLARR
jgi:peptidoglycan/xylan/chitin deacetylase (PgdA/CDA1 family)